jgi:lipoprotein-anchoring transpeptidase ErfK/SrfK
MGRTTDVATLGRRRTLRRDGRRFYYRLYAACASLVALAIVFIMWPRPVASSGPTVPRALTQWGPMGRIAPGAEISHTRITLAFRASAGDTAAWPEIELAEAGHPFTGHVSQRGQTPIRAGSASQTVRVVVSHLRDGVGYRWRVRLRGADGRTTAWSAPSPGASSRAPAFIVDLTAPAAPSVSSTSHPDPYTWYNTTLASLTWTTPADRDGIAGYAYSLDHSPDDTPPARLMTRGNGLSVIIPGDGTWYAHVRAVDRAGNWGPAGRFSLHVDRQPPAFDGVTFAHLAFDPDIEPEIITATLANRASLQVQIINQADGTLTRVLSLAPRAGAVQVVWDGQDQRGRPAPESSYRFLLRASDAFGQTAIGDYSGITVLRHRIVVSLRQQKMTVYEGSTPITSTLVTTGNKALPTPLGTFHILEKATHLTMISPWPRSSPFYYPPSLVQYALMFDWGGYYIHDAPWRSFFGPGSNSRSGTPGQNLTGTHGCINTPSDFAAWLYNWAPVGTVLQVVP